MTDKARMWAERVAEWRASEKTSEQFCEGRDFTAGLLRHWAWRLGRQQEKEKKPVVRMVRVHRKGLAEQSSPNVQTDETAAALVVAVGQARVAVRPGFDRATFAALMEVISAQAGGR